MPTFPRLIRIEALAKDQKLAASALVNSEGLCTCGRFLKRTDTKFLLGQVNSHEVPDVRARNSLVIAAYCLGCFQLINQVLRALKGSLAHPEPDQRRHENGA